MSADRRIADLAFRAVFADRLGAPGQMPLHRDETTEAIAVALIDLLHKMGLSGEEAEAIWRAQ